MLQYSGLIAYGAEFDRNHNFPLFTIDHTEMMRLSTGGTIAQNI